MSPSDPDDEEFFVPRVIESVNLGRRGKETRDRLIPTRDSGTSIGLYLGLKVVRNGSVAVFCGRKDTAANLCEMAVEWFDRGYDQSFAELLDLLRGHDVRIGANRQRPKVENVVEICESGFGYDGAMLVSTMADLVQPLDEELANALSAVHKRLKYGLPSAAAIVFYEIGFADRVVSMILAAGFPVVQDRAMAMFSLRGQRARAQQLLDDWPSYFSAILTELVNA